MERLIQTAEHKYFDSGFLIWRTLYSRSYIIYYSLGGIEI